MNPSKKGTQSHSRIKWKKRTEAFMLPFSISFFKEFILCFYTGDIIFT